MDSFPLPEQDQTTYQMLFEEMLDGFALLNCIQDENGRAVEYVVIAVNPAFKRIPGFPSGDIKGKTIREIFPENQKRLTETLDKVSLTATPARVELYSEEHSLYLSISAFRPLPGQIACIFRDITERKQMESLLYAERDSLANVLEGTNAGNWHWNVQTGELTVNERWAAIMGYSLEEMLPLSFESWRETTHPDDLIIAKKALERLFSGKAAYYDVEFRQKHKDGHWIWVNARGKVIQWTEDGKPLFMSGIHLDITDRKLAEKALRESEENLRVTLNSIGDGVIATDTEGRITQMNPVAETLTGWKAGDAQGRKLADVFQIINSRTREPIGNPAEKVLATGKTVALDNHTILISKGGSEHQIADSGAPILNIEGTAIGVVLVFRDVTYEYALQEQLRQSQKMEAVGQLAGGIAHDFNNLLQAILGYGEIALEASAQGKPVHDSIEQIIKAGTQAKIMTGQLLAFSRRQVLEMTLLDLNEVVTDITKIITRLIGEHITLNIRKESELRVTKADRGQIVQILTNLCINSRDAMPDGGTITVETANVNFSGQFCKKHVWARPGSFVLLSVADTGCGMNTETIKHVFDPFFSTKEVGKGTGLGLSTVYGLVQQHEGIIRISSELNKGATVKIYLPVTESTVKASSQASDAIPKGSETILLAEDDELVRNVCTRMLEKGGYKVISAGNGEEALQMFSKHQDEIKLALLDVLMPIMGGKKVYDRIREVCPEMRFLFASGYSMNAIHTNFILDQGISLLQKPYGSTDLLKKVREILDAPSTGETD